MGEAVSTGGILLAAAIVLWIECAASAVKAVAALSEEKAAMMIAQLLGAVFSGYLAANLWGMA